MVGGTGGGRRHAHRGLSISVSGADVNDGHEDSTYRTEYASVLDEALHTEEIRRALRLAEGVSGEPAGPGTELLRARALAAAGDIAGTAAAAYTRYAALRDAQRAGRRGDERGRAGRGREESAGPGITATLAVLVPMLSGIAAVAFLTLGFVLRAAGSGHRVTTSLTGVGFTMAAVFGVSLLVGLAGLVLTARRDAAAARTALEVAAARTAWRQSLLTEGVLPYLRACLDEDARAAGRPLPSAGVSLVRRRPKLGYTSPGFGSGGGVSLVRQRPKLGYTSPGFSSPADGGSSASAR